MIPVHFIPMARIGWKPGPGILRRILQGSPGISSLLAVLILVATSRGQVLQDQPPAQVESQQVEADRQAEESAERALGSIEGLSEPDVQTVDGDLVLTGVANDPAIIERAEQVVRDTTGRSRIRSDIELSSRLSDRFEGASARVTERFERWIAYLPLIPLAVVVLVLAIGAALLVGRWQWLYLQATSNPFLQDIARKLVQGVILLAGCLLALEILNATALVGGVLGAAGVAGIAIGFAFRDLVENYIASVLLSLRQPFRPRDHVEVDGHAGLVTAMNSRTTVLTTFDGNLVRIPNATVFKSTLVNYSTEPRRRFQFEVNVGYDVNLAQAIEVGVQTLRYTHGVLADPSPFAIVTQLQDSSIAIRLFAWVDQRTDDFGKVKSLALQNVKNAYDERDIDMPEPIYKLKFMSQLPSEVERPNPGSSGRVPPPTGSRESAPHDTAPDHDAEQIADSTARNARSEDLLATEAPAE